MKKVIYDEEDIIENRHQGLINAISYVLIIVFVVFMIISCFNYYYAAYPITGSSMEPTILQGDVVYVNKHTKADYGDIVVVYHEDDNEYLIKRVIALAGDELYCEAGTIYLKKAGESSFSVIDETNYLTTGAWNKNNNFEKIVVPANEVFFLGDNRNISKDSRELGTKKISDIVGVAPSWAMSIKSTAGKIYSSAQSLKDKMAN